MNLGKAARDRAPTLAGPASREGLLGWKMETHPQVSFACFLPPSQTPPPPCWFSLAPAILAPDNKEGSWELRWCSLREGCPVRMVILRAPQSNLPVLMADILVAHESIQFSVFI